MLALMLSINPTGLFSDPQVWLTESKLAKVTVNLKFRHIIFTIL